jgi:formylglycine-generating enzyme required for sulfatase activity
MKNRRPTRLSQQEVVSSAQRVVKAETNDFRELIRISGLDPATDLRFADWSGVSFSHSDLRPLVDPDRWPDGPRPFDFTGARLIGCDFTDSLIQGARFDCVEIDRVRSCETINAPLPDGNRRLRTTIRDSFFRTRNTLDSELGYHEARGWPHSLLSDGFNTKPWIEFVKSYTPLLSATSSDHLFAGSVFQDAPFSPELIVVPAGAFLMGSPADEPGHQIGEAQVPVTIAQPFAVGRFAVKFDEWDAYVADAEAAHKPDDQWGKRGNHPVINVSWGDALGYVAWLSKKTGQTYRLLSESEWEYAARAGMETPFCWGSSIIPTQANYNGSAWPYKGGGIMGKCRQQTVPVDQFEANHWGLFNVHGNVWEWCADHYYYTNVGNSGEGHARIGGDGYGRVVRGGAWNDDPQNLRSGYRQSCNTGIRSDNLGFRVARRL